MDKIRVAKVSFEKNGREYCFSCNKLDLKEGNTVIVDTERGLQYGFVNEVCDVDKNKYKNLKDVVRLTTKKDDQTYFKNNQDAGKALNKAREIVDELKLDMNIMEKNIPISRPMRLSMDPFRLNL